MLENPLNSSIVHGITTLFCMKISSHDGFHLDNQSIDCDWKTLKEWGKTTLPSFVTKIFMHLLGGSNIRKTTMISKNRNVFNKVEDG
jgi:hypothetical protein